MALVGLPAQHLQSPQRAGHPQRAQQRQQAPDQLAQPRVVQALKAALAQPG